MENILNKINNENDNKIETYLQASLTTPQIKNLLKLEGKHDDEINALVEKYEASKNKIKKFIIKFIDKIKDKHGDLDIPEIIKIGMKFAKKHGFTKAEEKAFINQVITGDIEKPYTPFPEMPYSEMSKFLCFSSVPSFMNIKATDQTILDEISVLFDASIAIHTTIKQKCCTYMLCSPEAITEKYNKNNHSSTFIHPVIAALFLPKIEAIEKRMLISNIGRIAIQYLADFHKKYQPITHMESSINFNLINNFAQDHNYISFSNHDTPLSIILKKFKIQINLYENVLALRLGRYYLMNDNLNDYISGLTKNLQNLELKFFDNPEYNNFWNESAYLKKLLAAFSLRPIIAELTSFTPPSTKMIANIPIVNVKLPMQNLTKEMTSVKLVSGLSQIDNFIINNKITQKYKTVIYCSDVLFFSVNRRQKKIDCTNTKKTSTIDIINTTEIDFDMIYMIKNNKFYLRSIVIVNPNGKECSSIIINYSKIQDVNNEYLYYNPCNKDNIISYISEETGDEKNPGFYELARKYGTIFIYSIDKF
jgi:hypothetical protein